MSLLTFEQARPWARAIAKEVGDRTMPPWHADAPAGTFHNERILTDAERETLVNWVSGGAPKGDPRDLPPAPGFIDGWSIGKPDIVLEMQEDYRIPGEGTIEYQWLYIPTHFTEPKWVKSIEIRPGNREAVHHVLVYYRAKPDITRAPLVRPNQKDQATPRRRVPGQRPQREDLKDVPQRLIATYAPGTNPQIAPDGGAFRLEPGGILELQMHYTTNGETTTDRTKIGLVFATEPSPREVRATHFFNGTFTLPAGAGDVAVSTDLEFLQDATVWAIFPHTHLRGKKWDYKLVLPSGESRPILSVPRYDFNWQTYYMFREPLAYRKAQNSFQRRGTTTRQRTRTTPIRKSTSSGATRPGRKCNTRVSCSPSAEATTGSRRVCAAVRPCRPTSRQAPRRRSHWRQRPRALSLARHSGVRRAV